MIEGGIGTSGHAGGQQDSQSGGQPSGNDYIIGLDKIDKNSVNVAGGKGANLGEMTRAGLPVPDAFIITTSGFNQFIDSNNLRSRIRNELAAVDIENIGSLKQASTNIANLIIGAQIPDILSREISEAYEELSLGKDIKNLRGPALDMIKAGRTRALVAVRSSATAEDLAGASFAGQLESVLGVQGRDSILRAIRQCWASLFTPRVIFYRKDKGFTEFPDMAVIVQKMVDADKSGVMFTANPINNSLEQMVIEATWGYGESIVSGLVTPDDYVIEKATGKVLSKKLGKKKWVRRLNPVSGDVKTENTDRSKVEAETLNEHELKKIFELGIHTEKHYGSPQDIEWAIEKGRVFLVQARPVTTISMPSLEEHGSEPRGKALISGSGASPGRATGKVRLIAGHDDMGKLEKGEILVTKMTSPAMVPLMRRAAAIVTDDGGKTCHAAIVSRELGIPCIVGTDMATSVLKDGMEVTVDAVYGKVYEGASSESPSNDQAGDGKVLIHEVHSGGGQQSPSMEAVHAGYRPVTQEEEHMQHHDRVAKAGITATEVKVNLAFPESLDSNPNITELADGVGLLRAEHMLTERGKHPVMLARSDPETLISIIVGSVGKIAKAFYPKPVWYRTLDARTDEFKELEGGDDEPNESNPMLGWHGIRRSIEQPVVFRCELKAIKRLHDQGMDNIRIMLPFISKIGELRKAKNIMRKEGIQRPPGIMVETPASALRIEEFCQEGIDFISIGSNDMTQLVLGVDRGNSHIAGLYSEFDPAVVDLIKFAIRTCRRHGVKTSLCGEIGSNPRMAELLVGIGIDSISAEADALEEIRRTIARTERRMLLERVRD